MSEKTIRDVLRTNANKMVALIDKCAKELAEMSNSQEKKQILESLGIACSSPVVCMEDGGSENPNRHIWLHSDITDSSLGALNYESDAMGTIIKLFMNNLAKELSIQYFREELQHYVEQHMTKQNI